MNWLKVTLSTAFYQLTILWREPVGLIISALVALGLVPTFGEIFGDFSVGLDGVYVRNVVVWEVFGLFLAAAAFFTIPIGFATLRAHGLLKLFRVAPITRSQVLVSFFTASFLYVLLFTVVMLVLNAILYGLYFPFTFDSIALLLLAAFLGGAAMISLGLILPTIFRSVSAIAPFGTLLFLPSFFISGLTIRTEDLPMAARIAGEVLPLTHTGRILTQAWSGGSITDVSYVSYLVLLAYIVVFTLISARFLKWE